MTEPISDYQPPIEPQIAPPITTPPSTPKKSPTPSIILGIVIIILLGGMGYFAYQYFALKSQLTVAHIPTPSPSIETVDPTANWKIYSNNKWKYSFKYPANWSLNNDVVSEYPWPLDGSHDPNYDKKRTYNAISMEVYPNQVWSEMTNADFFKSLSQIRLNETGSVGKGKGKKIFEGATKDNFPYVVFEVNASGGMETYSGIEGYILNNQVLAKAVLLSYNQQGINLFNQILSTFRFSDQPGADKFTNKSSSTDVQDWKTYTSPEVVEFFSPFSISYPLNWTLKEQSSTDNSGSLQVELEDSEKNQIMIIQGAGGGGNCVYPGDPGYETQEATKYYDKYTQLTKPANWRISKNKGESSGLKWELCQKSNDGYIDSTEIGWINISLSNQNALKEIQQILETVVYKPTSKTKTKFD